MKRILTLLLLTPSIAISQTWLAADNPNEIFTYLELNSMCPDDRAEYERLVEGVLVRSRLKTFISEFPVVQIIDDNGESTGDWAMHNWVMNEKPFLYLELSCGAKDSESYHLSINGRFAYVKYPNIVLLFDTLSTSLHGRQNADGIKDAFRKCVEDLLTFYLKANFNLGEE